jgi:hypothetical protein
LQVVIVIMVGFLEQIRWPQQRIVVGYRLSPLRVDRRVLELQTTKEILAEVFGVKISDVEEMIQNRYDGVRCEETSCEEEELWPREFRLGEYGP